MARYKVTKEQLERIVENFVMEASIETKKAPVKNMIPSQGAEAKKHIKNKMSGNMVDHSEGMPSVTPMKKKLSQAADAKKHMSKSGMKHTNKAKVVKEEEEKGNILDAGEVWNMIKGDIPKLQAKLASKGGSDFMAKPLNEDEENLSNMAPKELYNKLYPRVKDAVKKLGAVKEDGSVDMEVLKNEAKRKSLIGNVLMNTGIGTSVLGIATTAITWLLKNEIMKDMDNGLATGLALSGLGALLVGGVIASLGQPKKEAGEQGELARKQLEKKMGK